MVGALVAAHGFSFQEAWDSTLLEMDLLCEAKEAAQHGGLTKKQRFDKTLTARLEEHLAKMGIT